jgi:hypothetical protein
MLFREQGVRVGGCYIYREQRGGLLYREQQGGPLGPVLETSKLFDLYLIHGLI